MALDYQGTGTKVSFSTMTNPPTSPCLMFGWVLIDATSSIVSNFMKYRGSNNRGWSCKSEQWNNQGKIGFTKYGIVDETSTVTISEGNWLFMAFEYQSDKKIKYWKIDTSKTITSSTGANASTILDATGSGILLTLSHATDFIDGKLAWCGIEEGMAGSFSDNEILGMAFCPFLLFKYGRPDFFCPNEGNVGSSVENYGDQAGIGTVTGSVVKFSGNPPVVPLENFI